MFDLGVESREITELADKEVNDGESGSEPMKTDTLGEKMCSPGWREWEYYEVGISVELTHFRSDSCIWLFCAGNRIKTVI